MKENKAASHTSYTQAKGDRICELLLEGESLESVLKRKGMPSYRLFMYWLAGERIAPEEASALVQKYARARRKSRQFERPGEWCVRGSQAARWCGED